MAFALNQLGQVALPVTDVDRAEAFYEKTLGLRWLYRFGDLTFFDCAGVRLLLEKARDVEGARGVVFSSKPHLIARMEDHDLWMAFFSDPDGHTLALMQEAPKGYAPRPPDQQRRGRAYGPGHQPVRSSLLGEVP